MDIDRPGRSHWATWLLISLMGAIYVASLLFHLPYETSIRLGLVPEHPDPIGLFATLFLHASGVHLVVNAALLWFFGRSIEEALGPGVFLAFYLLGGLGANLAQIGGVRLFLPTFQDLPIVGASGAVSAVMGAFAAIHPRARIGRSTASGTRPGHGRAFGFAASWIWGLWVAAQVVGMVLSVRGSRQEVGSWGHGAGFALGLGAAMALIRLRGRPAHPTPQSPVLPSVPASVKREDGTERAARQRVDRALDLAVKRRSAGEALSAYRWVAERGDLRRLSPERRLEIASLLENEAMPDGALEILQRIAHDAPPEPAAAALLAAARIFAGPMQDPARAEEALALLESRYAQTRAAAFAPSERRRLNASGHGGPEDSIVN